MTDPLQSQWLEPSRLVENCDALRDHFRFDDRIADWANAYERGHLDHYRSILERVRRALSLSPGRRVLEVGAVPGHIPALLKHAGLDVTVVDLDPSRSATLFDALDIPAHAADIERDPLPLPDDSMDLVLFCEVLEHLRLNPLFAIEEVCRVLRPGGLCLLSTPQITPLMRWDFLRGVDYQGDLVAEFAKLETIGHMGHFRIYSEREVLRMAEHAGLGLVERSAGGKQSGANRGWVAGMLRRLRPAAMRTQIHLLLTPQ